MHAGDHRLHRLVPARSHNATSLRHALTRWAHEVKLPDDTAEAMALATYEAMVNVVTHAYPARADGSLELSAELRGNAVDVTVSDRGRWLPPAEDPGPLHGRGLPLIHALSDRAEVAPGPGGTTVRMRWPALPSPGAPGRLRDAARCS
ncbi:ATP-binding protein [Amycolatopsis endophytica]|uniref:Anti-sigma regulatory factor (Ser/Thr protein kinase) n=1 Tax=Amycolatopsis endophytica TaxID=860233 RepID=A0A853B859_9PSEU|nr:ATP-binding protein [Amycolatopsis endophytica]NYI90944.1 anti-sigma regulatory factor (Ser/Thr protein kinase) [Amycolatopsis endophytica]